MTFVNIMEFNVFPSSFFFFFFSPSRKLYRYIYTFFFFKISVTSVELVFLFFQNNINMRLVAVLSAAYLAVTEAQILYCDNQDFGYARLEGNRFEVASIQTDVELQFYSNSECGMTAVGTTQLTMERVYQLTLTSTANSFRVGNELCCQLKSDCVVGDNPFCACFTKNENCPENAIQTQDGSGCRCSNELICDGAGGCITGLTNCNENIVSGEGKETCVANALPDSNNDQNCKCNDDYICNQQSGKCESQIVSCMQQIITGDKCTPNAYVADGVCICPHGYSCTEGGSCEYALEARCNSFQTDNHTRCVNNTNENDSDIGIFCSCKPNYNCNMETGKCDSVLGKCSTPSDDVVCVEDSENVQGTCTCKEGTCVNFTCITLPSDGKCNNNRDSMQQCTAGTQFNVETGVCTCNEGECFNSFCVTARCMQEAVSSTCDSQFVLYDSKCACPKQQYCTQVGECETYSSGRCDELLTEDKECSPNSSPFGGACICDFSYYCQAGACVQKVFTYGRCGGKPEEGADCWDNMSLDNEGICRCNAGFGCTIGGFCRGTTNTGECDDFTQQDGSCTANTEVYFGECICKAGYNCDSGKCLPLACDILTTSEPTTVCIENSTLTVVEGGRMCVCSDPLKCIDSVCLECVESSDCNLNLECINSTCIDTSCSVLTDCNEGEACIEQKCISHLPCDLSVVEAPSACVANSTLVEVTEGNVVTKTCKCNSPYICQDKVCVECLLSSHCDAGQACVDDVCVQPEACLGTSCPDGFSCIDSLCFPERGCDLQLPDTNNFARDPCAPNSELVTVESLFKTCQCTASFQCLNSTCIECSTPADCVKDGYTCENNKCVKNIGCGVNVTADESNFCGANSQLNDTEIEGVLYQSCICNSDSGYECIDNNTCVRTSCKNTSDCSDDEECIDNKCTIRGCNSSDDCASPLSCLSGKCAIKCNVMSTSDTLPCTDNSDYEDSICKCSSDFECSAGECVENFIRCNIAIPTEGSKPCTEFSNPESGQCHCKQQYQCEETGRCGFCGDNCFRCISNDECSLDKICSGGSCVEGCDLLDDCSNGKYCVNSTCVPCDGPCPECSENDDCSFGMTCKDGICKDGCDNNDDCDSNQYCSDNKCSDRILCNAEATTTIFECVHNSIAEGTRCVCNNTFRCNDENGMCERAPLPCGVDISEELSDFECLSNSSRDGDQCVCNIGFDCVEAACQRKACTSDCGDVNLVCVEGLCQSKIGCNMKHDTLPCKQNSEKNTENTCICTGDLMCTINNECIEKQCNHFKDCEKWESNFICKQGVCAQGPETKCGLEHTFEHMRENPCTGNSSLLSDGKSANCTCEAAYNCSEGICQMEQPECNSTNECVAPLICSSEGVCVADTIACDTTYDSSKSCDQNSALNPSTNNCECNNGYQCRNAKCDIICTTAADCDFGFGCLSGVCTKRSPGCGVSTELGPIQCPLNSYLIIDGEMMCTCRTGYACIDNLCLPGCQLTSDCKDDQVCVDTKCEMKCKNCSEGVCINGECVKDNVGCDVEVSALQLVSLSCTENSEKTGTNCRCKVGYVCDDKKCDIDTSQSCTSDTQCEGLTCKDNICQKALHCGMQTTTGFCADEVNSSPQGGMCTCNYPFECIDSQCISVAGHCGKRAIEPSAQQQVLPGSNGCTDNSTPSDGICICDRGYQCKTGACFLKPKPDLSCDTPSAVCVPNAEHNDAGICKCITPYTCDISGLCRDLIGTCGGAPAAGSDCGANMFVNPQNICQCSKGFGCKDGACEEKLSSGECGDYQDNSSDDLKCKSENMFVGADFKCTCPYPLSCDDDTGDCLDKSTQCNQPAGSGFVCVEFSDRNINGICICDGGYICHEDGHCFDNPEGGKCNNLPSKNNECGENAIFVVESDLCICQFPYQCVSGACVLESNEAACDTLKNGNICTVNSVVSSEGICKCSNGYECFNSDGKCRGSLPLSGKCDELPSSSFASGCNTNMKINNGVCKCNTPLACIDGQCHDRTGLCGYSPTTTGGCTIYSSENNDGICTCTSRHSCQQGACELITGLCDSQATDAEACYEYSELSQQHSQCRCISGFSCVFGYCQDSVNRLSWGTGRTLLELERWTVPHVLNITTAVESSLGSSIRISQNENCEQLLQNGDFTLQSNAREKTFTPTSELTENLRDNLVICTLIGTTWTSTTLRINVRGISVSTVNATTVVNFERTSSLINVYYVDGVFSAPAIFYEVLIADSCEQPTSVNFIERLIMKDETIISLAIPIRWMPKPAAEIITLKMCIRRIESTLWHSTPVVFVIKAQELMLNGNSASEGTISIARGVEYSFKISGGNVKVGDVFKLSTDCSIEGSTAQLSFNGIEAELVISDVVLSRLPQHSPLVTKLCRSTDDGDSVETGFTFTIEDLSTDSNLVGTLNGTKTITLWYGQPSDLSVQDRSVPGAVNGIYIFASVDGTCTKKPAANVTFIVSDNLIRSFEITGSVGRKVSTDPVLCESRDGSNYVRVVDISIELKIPRITSFVVGDQLVTSIVLGTGEQSSPIIHGTIDALLLNGAEYTIFVIPVTTDQIEQGDTYCDSYESSSTTFLLSTKDQPRLLFDSTGLGAGDYGICLSGDWGATAATMDVLLKVKLPVVNIDREIIIGIGAPRDIYFTATAIGNSPAVLFSNDTCDTLTSDDLVQAIPVRRGFIDTNEYYIPLRKEDVVNKSETSFMCLFSLGIWYSYPVDLKIVEVAVTFIREADENKEVHVARMVPTPVFIDGVALSESVAVTFSVNCSTARESPVPAITKTGDISTLLIDVENIWPANGTALELKICFWSSKGAYDGAPGYSIVLDTPKFVSWSSDTEILNKEVENGFEGTVEIITSAASPLLPLWLGLTTTDCTEIEYKFNVHFQSVDIDISDASSKVFKVCINYDAHRFNLTNLTLTVSSQFRVDTLIRQKTLVYAVCEACTHTMTVEGSGLKDGNKLKFANACDDTMNAVILNIEKTQKDGKGGLINTPVGMVAVATTAALKVCLLKNDGSWQDTGITFEVVSDVTSSILVTIANTDHVVVPRGFTNQRLEVAGIGPAFVSGSLTGFVKLSTVPFETYHFDSLVVQNDSDFRAAVRKDIGSKAAISPHLLWVVISQDSVTSVTKINVSFPSSAVVEVGEPIWTAVLEEAKKRSADGKAELGFQPSQTIQKIAASCNSDSSIQKIEVDNMGETSLDVSAWVPTEFPIIQTGICFATLEGQGIIPADQWTLTDLTFSVADLKSILSPLSAGTHAFPVTEGYSLEHTSIKLCDDKYKDLNIYVACSDANPTCTIYSSGVIPMIDDESLLKICLKTDISNNYFEQVATVRLVSLAKIHQINSSEILSVQVGSSTDIVYSIEGEGFQAGSFLVFVSQTDNTVVWVPIQKVVGEQYSFGIQLQRDIVERPNQFKVCFSSEQSCDNDNFVTVEVVQNESESRVLIGVGDDSTDEHVLEHGIGTLPVHGTESLEGRTLFLIQSDSTKCDPKTADILRIRKKGDLEYVRISLKTTSTGIYSICLERATGTDVYVKQDTIQVHVDKELFFDEVICHTNSLCMTSTVGGIANDTFEVHQNVGGVVSFTNMSCELGCYIRLGECDDNTADVITLTKEGLMSITPAHTQNQVNHGQLCFSRDRFIFVPISVTATVTPIQVTTIAGMSNHFTMSHNSDASLPITGSIFGKVGIAFIGNTDSCDFANITNTFWIENSVLFIPSSFTSDIVTAGRLCVTSHLLVCFFLKIITVLRL